MNIRIVIITVLATALGLAGVTTAAIYALPIANAASCKDEPFHHTCHGCSTTGQGFESSDKKCAHVG